MEFNEKLQELRKSKGMTQEELAQALYVSRTAVSKWESGRGYPSIDSLREISRFFGVTIDELICSEEMISVAEDEKRTYTERYLSFVFGALDFLTAILLFLPAFGNGSDAPAAVSVFQLTGVRSWIRIVFIVLLSITGLNGLCGLVLLHFDHPVWNRHRRVTGLALLILETAVFIVTRQPYAGIFCFSLLAVKAIMLYKGR